MLGKRTCKEPSDGWPRARCRGTEEGGSVPTVLLKLLGLIRAVEELALEELDGHHSEDEHEEHVDDEDVEDVFERVHNAVKDSLERTGGPSQGPG